MRQVRIQRARARRRTSGDEPGEWWTELAAIKARRKPAPEPDPDPDDAQEGPAPDADV